MSECGHNVKSSDAEELQQCLPMLNDILSEIANMVMLTQQQQQQPLQQDEELVWDSSHDYTVYSDVSSYCSSSDISSDSDTSYVESEAEEKQLMEEIFIGGMVEAIEKAAPGCIFNAIKSD